jgi:hypothetical protein
MLLPSHHPLALRAAGEELSDGLLFSPSSSEGRYSASGRFSGASSARSYAEVVAGRGKSSEVARSVDPDCSKEKKTMDPTLLASSSGQQDGVGRPASVASGTARREEGGLHGGCPSHGFGSVLSPAIGTCGGILVAWRASTSHHVFSISVKIKHVSQDQDRWLTTVYGPSVKDQKASFLDKLNDCYVEISI